MSFYKFLRSFEGGGEKEKGLSKGKILTIPFKVQRRKVTILIQKRYNTEVFSTDKQNIGGFFDNLHLHRQIVIQDGVKIFSENFTTLL